MTKIQKERNLKLAEALESKEYTQTTGQLREGNRFCCLGVACDVYHKETGNGRWLEDSFVIGKDTQTKMVPVAVAEWFGWNLDWGNPVIEVKLGREVFAAPATSLNDIAGATFSTIAKGFRGLAA